MVTRVPDHSLLHVLGYIVVGVTELKVEESEASMVRKFSVPEEYLEGEVERVRRLRNRVMDSGMTR